MKNCSKKMIAILLALVLCVAISACGGGADKAVAEQALTPSTDLPGYSETFQFVVDQAGVNTEKVDSFIGYAIAAYETYDAKAFSQYAYEQLDPDVFSDMQDQVATAATGLENEKTSESFTAALELRNFNVQLSSANLSFAGCNEEFAAGQMNGSDTDYEELKSSYVFCINQYCKLFYGEELLLAE